MANSIRTPHILIVSHMYPSTFNEIGGIFVHQQVKELKRQGCEVKVISPVPWTPLLIKYFSKKWHEYAQIPSRAVLDGVEVFYPRYLSFPRALFFHSSGKKMYRGIKKLVNEIYKNFKFDLIHSHVVLPSGYAGMKIAKQYKKPLIVTIHGADLQQTIYKNENCWKKIKEVIKFSTKTIVVSNKLRRVGEKELDIDAQKFITIPNGIDLENIYQGKSELIKKYKNKKIILSVSNLIKTKGIDLNLKAIARLKNKYQNIIHLIIGEGSERRNLEKLVQGLEIEKNVKFLGQLTHKTTMEYISICNLFSLPSWKEAFGVVYIEAMAHGKQVVACKGEGPEDFIKNKETGLLVRPKDIDSLVEAIDFLLSNPKKAKEMGERARRLVFENYTWERVVKKIIEVYNSVVD